MYNVTLKRSKLHNDFIKNLNLTLLALPTIIFIFIFNYIPLYGLILPFKDYNIKDGFIRSKWIGLKNFEYLFNEKTFEITRNTLVLNMIFIIFSVLIPVTLAILLFELGKKGTRVYQTIMFFPFFVSWVVAAYAFLGLLDADYGIVNKVLNILGKESVVWYSEYKYWPFILVLAYIWKNAGFSTIIYYTALMGISPEYYESAKLDGASKFKQAIYISIPQLKPLIIMLVILNIGKIFYSDFGLFYNLTLDQQQLYPVTDVIDTFVFRALRTLGDFGMSSAASFYQSLMGFLLVIITNYFVGKVNNDYKLY